MTTALTADTVRAQLRVLGSPAKAEASSWFFKTGAGQYGEGDVFLGVTVPELRRVAKAAMGMDHREVLGLLHSPEHECRLAALLVWTYQFTKGSEPVQQRIFEDYLANTGWINNWDLVDASCREIVGGWLFDRDRSTLDRLAVSDSVWERRIAIVSTFHFIRLGQPQDTLRIADLLIDDRHDLIHKALGWMLREVGKRCDQAIEEEWLQTRYRTMPRTMLRYAIERFTPERRQAYLQGRAWADG